MASSAVVSSVGVSTGSSVFMCCPSAVAETLVPSLGLRAAPRAGNDPRGWVRGGRFRGRPRAGESSPIGPPLSPYPARVQARAGQSSREVAKRGGCGEPVWYQAQRQHPSTGGSGGYARRLLAPSWDRIRKIPAPLGEEQKRGWYVCYEKPADLRRPSFPVAVRWNSSWCLPPVLDESGIGDRPTIGQDLLGSPCRDFDLMERIANGFSVRFVCPER